jgi:hypothetical protein
MAKVFPKLGEIIDLGVNAGIWLKNPGRGSAAEGAAYWAGA